MFQLHIPLSFLVAIVVFGFVRVVRARRRRGLLVLVLNVGFFDKTSSFFDTPSGGDSPSSSWSLLRMLSSLSDAFLFVLPSSSNAVRLFRGLAIASVFCAVVAIVVVCNCGDNFQHQLW
jgi:hypothetical protein